MVQPELESRIVPSSPTCFPLLLIAFLVGTKKGIIRPKGGLGGLGLFGWLTAAKALFSFLSSFCRRHLSVSLSSSSSTAQADGSGKEEGGEADIAAV